MKVLLVSTNRFMEPMPVLPIGVGCLSRALKDAGHEVEVLDMLWEDDPPAAAKAKVAAFEPGLVGISIRNTDDYIVDPPKLLLPMIKDVVASLKETGLASSQIIVGGPPVGDMRRDLLGYLDASFGCIGEGEETLVEFVDALKEGRDLVSVPGVCSLVSGEYHEEPAGLPSATTIATPDYDAYDERYFNKPNKYGLKASLSIQAKRGCTYKCIYCTVPKINGATFRLREPKEVVDEFMAIAAREPGRTIEFIDNDFNCPPAHADEVCKELIRRGNTTPWSCAIHPTFTTQPQLQLMKEAGCEAVDVGIDTVSPKMMKNLGRPLFTKEKLVEVNQWCKDLGLWTCYACLLGGPGENVDTLRETFDALEELEPLARPGWPTCVFYGGIRVYPDTEMRLVALAEGVVKEDDPLLFPELYMSDELDEAAYRLVDERKRKHPDWLLKGTGLERGLKKYGLARLDEDVPPEAVAAPAAADARLPDRIFPDLGDTPTGLRHADDRTLVLMVAWMKNREDTKLWYKALKERCAELEGMRFQVLAAIPPLPHFVTPDFIKTQLAEAEQHVGKLLLDWDAKFATDVLGIELGESTPIVAANAAGAITFRSDGCFTEEDLGRVAEALQNIHAGPQT